MWSARLPTHTTRHAHIRTRKRHAITAPHEDSEVLSARAHHGAHEHLRESGRFWCARPQDAARTCCHAQHPLRCKHTKRWRADLKRNGLPAPDGTRKVWFRSLWSSCPRKCAQPPRALPHPAARRGRAQPTAWVVAYNDAVGGVRSCKHGRRAGPRDRVGSVRRATE